MIRTPIPVVAQHKARRQSKDRSRKIGRAGRRAALVRNDLEFVPFAREPQDRF
jgi:hypothetical protein